MGEGTPTGELTFIQRWGADPRSAPNTYRESHEALQKTIGTRLPSYSTKGVTSRGASVTGADRRGADRVSLFRILIGEKWSRGAASLNGRDSGTVRSGARGSLSCKG